MGNVVIIGIITAIIVMACSYSVKHFRGEGGCCGGGSYKPKRKRLSGVKYKKVFRVGGLHCEHCRRRVEEAINDITGIAGRVNLKRGELCVSYAEDVDDATISWAIARAGYTLMD